MNSGVNIYGVDTYSLDLAIVKKAINTIPSDAGNVSHQPENKTSQIRAFNALVYKADLCSQLRCVRGILRGDEQVARTVQKAFQRPDVAGVERGYRANTLRDQVSWHKAATCIAVLLLCFNCNNRNSIFESRQIRRIVQLRDSDVYANFLQGKDSIMSQSLRTHSIWSKTVRKSAATVFAVALCMGHAASSQAQVTVPSSVVTTGTKPYVAVANGAGTSPYLIYGVQLRIDELLGNDYTAGTTWPAPANPPASDSADYYFLQAKNVGFKTVVVPVHWKYIDITTPPGAAAYNFEYVHKIINDANTNQLKVQLLWYGSDVCGYPVVPKYITDNPSTYPKLATNTNLLDLSNSNLVNTETNALVAMMNDVASYDTNKAVVMVQIENEPDGAAGVNINWNNSADIAAKMYAGGQYNAVIRLINHLAVAVKTVSNWHGVTRVNIGSSYRAIDVAYDRNQWFPGGVDIFGVDQYAITDPNWQPWITDITKLHNILAELAPPALFAKLSPIPTIDPQTSIYGTTRSPYVPNVTHQPEGGGQFGNLICRILSNFADGGGGMIYELRTLQNWQDPSHNYDWQPVYDLGIFRRMTSANKGTWTARTGDQLVGYDLNGGNPGVENSTAAITTFNTTIYKADQKIALARPDTCAAFNIEGLTSNAQTLNVAGIPVTFQTWSKAQAFAMQDTNGTTQYNGDLILLNFVNGNNFTIDPSFHHATTASVGYYDATNVWHEQYIKTFPANTPNTLVCWAGDCIRIPRLP